MPGFWAGLTVVSGSSTLACNTSLFYLLLQKQRAFAAFDFEALRGEVRRVEAVAATAASPIVFSHNDLLSGGWVYSRRPMHTTSSSSFGLSHRLCCSATAKAARRACCAHSAAPCARCSLLRLRQRCAVRLVVVCLPQATSWCRWGLRRSMPSRGSSRTPSSSSSSSSRTPSSPRCRPPT